MTSDLFPLLKHPRMQDVAMEVRGVTQVDTDLLSLDVYWWNIGRCHAPYPMAVFQNFKVTRSWFHDLELYEYQPGQSNVVHLPPV